MQIGLLLVLVFSFYKIGFDKIEDEIVSGEEIYANGGKVFVRVKEL